MVKIVYFKRKIYFFCISIILIINILSISFIPNQKINNLDHPNNDNDSDSQIQLSSNGPTNKHFFKYYKGIRIDHNKVSGTGSHKNFPVLISTCLYLSSKKRNQVPQRP